MPRSDYEARQNARRERLADKAERLRKEAQARSKAGWDALHAIPFGQPILVGHHSEQRDRNYRKRAIGNIDKSVMLNKAAGEAEARADNMGSGGISSDDPTAIDKLKAKLAKLEAEQAQMVATNKAVRSKDPTAALTALGFGAATIGALLTPDYAGRKGIPSYALSNASAVIRQTRQRIEQLERECTRVQVVTETNIGLTAIENTDANRVQLIFPGKPDAETRTLLKRYGFRWSPSEGAWQRLLNNAGIYAARTVIDHLTAKET
jgi:hypothetical protein